ncbi:hypothetical protein A3219_23895, partial [Salmonella enterica]
MGIVGAVVGGWISTFFGFGKVDGFNFGSFAVAVILGIVGAVVGGWISTFFGFGKVDGFNFGSFAVAV